MGVLSKIRMMLLSLVAVFVLGVQPVAAQPEPSGNADDSVTVMKAFNEQAMEQQKMYELTDDEKHQILFFMGVVLLVLLCATAYLGISMGVWGKDVFVPHMICAGLTVTLGIAHAVAAVVWFFPFEF